MFDKTTLIIAKGSFVEECTNRFLCKVDLPEVGQTLCYVPSSARLTNLIALERRTVCLSLLAKSSRSRFPIKKSRIESAKKRHKYCKKASAVV